jgi:hypothetical protein
MKMLVVDGYDVLFDECLSDEILSKKWSVTKNKNVFYVRSGQTYMHRFVMSAKKGQMIDHINGNGLDNRLSNLRFSCHQANRANSHFGTYTSKYIGVSAVHSKTKTRFRVQAKVCGKKMHLGYFDDEVAAAIRYDEHAKTTYGEKAILNFA